MTDYMKTVAALNGVILLPALVMASGKPLPTFWHAVAVSMISALAALFFRDRKQCLVRALVIGSVCWIIFAAILAAQG